MTTLAYGCVAAGGRTFADPKVIGRKPPGASKVFNNYRLIYPVTLNDDEIAALIESFKEASVLVKNAGFDAVKIHAGHGCLLSQFLSPYTNRRNDRWGGSAEKRCCLPASVVEAVRAAVGEDFPILVKMNVSDGISGGLEIEGAPLKRLRHLRRPEQQPLSPAAVLLRRLHSCL
ncbi:MAG: hypothetical protein DRP70_12325 [Spirochaetes bacterium]|nr:MAG: hypothetical protein DRP70_12325 [Spirochaetota bacterium]